MPDWALGPIVLALAGFLYWFSIRPALKEPPLSEIEGDDEPAEALPPATEDCHIYDCKGRRSRHTCGHVDRVRFKIALWGELVHEHRGWRVGKRCANCALAELKRISIRCCRCGHVILPGKMVAIYVRSLTHPFEREWTTRVGSFALGCLRTECADGGHIMSGHWMGDEGYRPYRRTFGTDF